MTSPTLTPEAVKAKSDPVRSAALKPHAPAAVPAIPNFLGAAGNMAVQRAAMGPIPGSCSCGSGACPECAQKPVQRKRGGKREADVAGVPRGFHDNLHRSGSGAPLRAHTRSTMEDRFGERFDDVRIHDDNAAAEAAQDIRAHAFTTGRDVYFGHGRYQPETTEGRKLLAHELTHVLQQRKGRVQGGLKSLAAGPSDDVFEQEAEQVEAHVGRGEHGLPASANHSSASHGAAAGETLQRKCACSGTTAATEQTQKPPVQRKGQDLHPAIALDSEKKKPETALTGQTQSPPVQRKGQDPHPEAALDSEKKKQPDQAIQRKCDCGGTCPKCSAAEPTQKVPVQRKGQDLHPAVALDSEKKKEPETALTGQTQSPPVQRKGQNLHPAVALDSDRKKEPEPSSGDAAIQRKCGCGGTCPKCSGAEPDIKTPVQRKGAHKTPADTGKGEAKHDRPRGRLVPGIQRSASAPAAKASARGDRFEREAADAADTIAQDGHFSSDKISDAGGERLQRFDWTLCNLITDPDCTLSSTAEVVGGVTQEVASEVWDEAKALANAVEGFLEWVDNLLTITIGPKHVCDAHSVQVSLPEIGVDLPFLAGAVPIAPGVEIYGEVGLHLGIIPEVSLQVGPCETHTITIAIHPVSLGGSVSGGFDLTLALGLGAEPRASLFGEVGVIIEWPDPPIILQVPVARLEAGLAGFFRAIAADKMSVDFSASAGITGFSFSTSQQHDLGFALDLGLAGFGALTVLGQNLCTLYWPLLETHRDAALSLGFDLGLDIGATSLPSLSADVTEADWGKLNWGDLGIEIQRDMFKDDCPLCDFLYELGLMPSQRGGSWKGHPKPAWKTGPLRNVYPRDPGIKSEALCRGACGPDCDTCKHDPKHRECVETGDGCHKWWIYPNYEVCGSHLGCRNHDACYDWCVDKYNEKGKLGIILGPCHRLCDFECICDYNLPQCVGWIGGGKPHDSQMIFSDAPHEEPGCRGPCPKENKLPGGAVEERLCLPNINLFDRQTLFHRDWHHSTGDIIIFSVPLEIPYIPPPTLDVFVRGEVAASLDAGIGPVTLEGCCLIFHPSTGAYSGTGSIHLKGDVNGLLSLTGILGAKAGWGCLLNVIDLEVIRGEAGLTATGRAKLPVDLSLTANLSCRDGKLMLDTEALFKACLDLSFQLDASLRVMLFKRFEIFQGEWNLLDKNWGKCWEIPLGVTSGVIGAAACGGGKAASILPPAPAPIPAPAPGVTPPTPRPPSGPAHAPAFAIPEIGNVDNLSIPGLISDLFHLATGTEVIHDKTHGGLPSDPAKAANQENPCGEDVTPDDECGSPQLPNSVISWTGSDRGEVMVAEPLTKCGPHGSDPSIRLPAWACIDAANDNNFWVHAHLLHGRTGINDLHGPGDQAKNLILTDKSINGQMSNQAENGEPGQPRGSGGAIRRIHNQNQTLSYRVEALHVANSGDRRYFANGMRISLNRIDPVTRQVTEAIFNDTITSNKPRPIPSNCT